MCIFDELLLTNEDVKFILFGSNDGLKVIYPGSLLANSELGHISV